MNPRRNRWTGRPHLHQRERDRRARQLRHRLMRELLLASEIIEPVEHLIIGRDPFTRARVAARLVERARSR